jgi:hypothetical protein
MAKNEAVLSFIGQRVEITHFAPHIIKLVASQIVSSQLFLKLSSLSEEVSHEEQEFRNTKGVHSISLFISVLDNISFSYKISQLSSGFSPSK